MYRLCLQSNLRLSCSQAEILYAYLINQRVLHAQHITYYLISVSVFRQITNYGTCLYAVLCILLLPLSSQVLKMLPDKYYEQTRQAVYVYSNTKGGFTHSIACRAHAVPLPCRAAKGLECVFPILFTQCGRV
jgi:hypothetical protein